MLAGAGFASEVVLEKNIDAVIGDGVGHAGVFDDGGVHDGARHFGPFVGGGDFPVAGPHPVGEGEADAGNEKSEKKREDARRVHWESRRSRKTAAPHAMVNGGIENGRCLY